MIKVPGSSACFFFPLFPAFPAFFSSMIGSECTQLPPRSSERPPQLSLLSRHSQALPLPQNSTFGCCCDPTSPGGCQDLSCPTERAPACASSLPIPDPPRAAAAAPGPGSEPRPGPATRDSALAAKLWISPFNCARGANRKKKKINPRFCGLVFTFWARLQARERSGVTARTERRQLPLPSCASHPVSTTGCTLRSPWPRQHHVGAAKAAVVAAGGTGGRAVAAGDAFPWS